MKNSVLLLTFLLFVATGSAQEEEQRESESGRFSLGMRTTFSAFDNTGYPGMGFGGHFRIQLAKKLNTEWFADYITADIGGVGKRTDGHIGWSVMFYPFDQKKKADAFSPYLLAGHCFDYTKLSANGIVIEDVNYRVSNFDERWSSAVHLGLGTHYNFTENFDMSLAVQYMSHLGNDIHGEVKKGTVNNQEVKYLDIHDHGEKGLSMEGHLLVSLSVNLLVADLWK